MHRLKRLYFEPTSNCNLNCTMCFRRTWFDETPGDMTPETYKNALDTMPDTVETIFFGGMGEPLFNKNIIEMVRLAALKVPDVQLLTNATLLDAEMARALLDAGLTMLWISIDSFEKEDYESIRLNSKFDLVTRNMRTFNGARAVKNSSINLDRGNKYIKLGVTFVVMKSNIGQLGLLPQFMMENYVDEVNISNVYPSDPEAEKESLYLSSMNGMFGAKKVLKDRPVISLPYMDWNTDIVWDGLRPIFRDTLHSISISDTPLYRKTEYCRFIEDGIAFVRFDGDVAPCMALLHNGSSALRDQKRIVHHHSFGNVNTQPLTAIWENRAYFEFRERVHRFDFSPCIHCGHCDMGLGNQQDCLGNESPTCGGCLWGEGVIRCP